MKKFTDKLEEYLVLTMMWVIIYTHLAIFMIPIIGEVGYFLIVICTFRRFTLFNKVTGYYWRQPEDCPTVDWCEKLTMRLFNNEKY